MIELTKINGELIIINSRLIEYIVAIPETKIIMINGRYHIVKEPAEEIVRKVIAYEQKVAEGFNGLGDQLLKNIAGLCNPLEAEPSSEEEEV